MTRWHTRFSPTFRPTSRSSRHQNILPRRRLCIIIMDRVNRPQKPALNSILINSAPSITLVYSHYRMPFQSPWRQHTTFIFFLNIFPSYIIWSTHPVPYLNAPCYSLPILSLTLSTKMLQSIFPATLSRLLISHGYYKHSSLPFVTSSNQLALSLPPMPVDTFPDPLCYCLSTKLQHVAIHSI